MKIAKSSYTLPVSEISMVEDLKVKLKFKSNTQVIRLALKELYDKFNRKSLQAQFSEASRLVSSDNRDDYEELDRLSDEGIE